MDAAGPDTPQLGGRGRQAGRVPGQVQPVRGDPGQPSLSGQQTQTCLEPYKGQLKLLETQTCFLYIVNAEAFWSSSFKTQIEKLLLGRFIPIQTVS